MGVWITAIVPAGYYQCSYWNQCGYRFSIPHIKSLRTQQEMNLERSEPSQNIYCSQNLILFNAITIERQEQRK